MCNIIDICSRPVPGIQIVVSGVKIVVLKNLTPHPPEKNS